MFKDVFDFFKDIYQNRVLLKQFSMNDFKARYAGSVLGIFWAFANPLVMVLTYWFVFSFGFRSGDKEGLPFILFLISGLVPWLYFSENLGAATNVFREYSYLVKKVVFNIRILPTVKLASNIFIHVFFIAITFIVAAVNGIYPSLQSIQLIYYLFAMMMFLTGLTWITSSIQPFFPDINQFIVVIMQALMWGTPVLWSVVDFAGHPTIQFILRLNPMFYVVQGYRDAFFGRAWFWESPQLTIYFWVVTIVMLLLGAVIFKRLRPHFSDVL